MKNKTLKRVIDMAKPHKKTRSVSFAPSVYTNNRLNEGKDLRKDSADIQEKKRRRTVCTSSFFDDDSGAGFLQRFPEFKWLLV